MKIVFKVTDFLKIEQAEIDITNFCVFIGNNNSGKTKLMELIYGVLDYLSQKMPKLNYRFSNNRIVFKQERIEEIIGFANEVLNNEKEKILQSIFNKELSVGSMRLEVTDIDRWYEAVQDIKGTEIVYAEEGEDVGLANKSAEILKNMKFLTIRIYRNGTKASRKMLAAVGFPEKCDRKYLESSICKEIMRDLLGLGGSSHLFLPASRMGLSMLYKEYFNNMGTKQENWFDNEGTLTDVYQQSDHVTKPVLNYLRFLQGYSFNIVHAKQNEDLIDFVNEHLLDGALNEQGDVAAYMPKNSDIKIPLYLASSMINEIDPIIKMLTNRRKTTMLFYDEVETSLHPLKQLELVKLLNRLNNKGMRMMIATHSDTFVTKLNNLLILARSGKIGEQPVSLRNGKIEISRDDLLKTDDIHIYQFINQDNGRSVVSELEFRTAPMTGYSFELFEDSSTSLFEETKLALGIES